MTHNSSVKTANLKPFKKGEDSRRNPTGAKSAARAAWETRFRNILAEKLPPEEAVEILIKAYRARQSWAVQEVHERLMGKVKQPTDVNANVLFRIIYDKEAKGK